MGKIDLSNVVTVSVLSAQRGLTDVNTSVLALITKEVPIPSDYGTYRVYRNALGVAQDFGSNSVCYQLATMVFSQSQNPTTGGGYLVVVPRLQSAPAQPAVILSQGVVDLTTLTANDYTINVAINESETPTALTIGSIDTTSVATVLASLNTKAVSDAGLVFSISGSIAAARIQLATKSTGNTARIGLVQPETGTDLSDMLDLYQFETDGKRSAMGSGANAGLERINDCILRTADEVGYFGVIVDETLTISGGDANNSDLQYASMTIQSMDRLFLWAFSSSDVWDVAKSYLSYGLTHSRALFYSTGAMDALKFCAGYASIGLSTNFNGTATAKTMHLKQISGIGADPGMTQTLLNQARDAGVDVYADFGVPRTFTSGANEFYDQVYNRLAFKLRLQVAGFNFLATTTGKIPQTEEGMNGLKSAYRNICELFVTNGVFAPGTWNGSTFGDAEDFIRNIEEVGYYIYSEPVASQSQTVRESRVAPVISIAAKESGAIHSSDVIVYIEA